MCHWHCLYFSSTARLIAGLTVGSILFVGIFIVLPIICCIVACVYVNTHSSRRYRRLMVTPTTTVPSTTTTTITDTASSEATPGPYTSPDPKESGYGAPPPPYSAVPLASYNYPVQPDQAHADLSPDASDLHESLSQSDTTELMNYDLPLCSPAPSAPAPQ